jgi:hypothetical protein
VAEAGDRRAAGSVEIELAGRIDQVAALAADRDGERGPAMARKDVAHGCLRGKDRLRASLAEGAGGDNRPETQEIYRKSSFGTLGMLARVADFG